MDWKTLPGFEEKYAKVSVKTHKTFDGKVIEVLYGAKDADGNPVMPKEVGTDGAGRWFGIETNGEYRMFSLTRPACDGGTTEYGTSHNDTALEDMENDIRAKVELAKQIENADDDEFDGLIEKWNAIENWDTPREKNLEERKNHALNRHETRKAEENGNKEKKLKLLEEAKSYVNSTEWKKVAEVFKALEEEWNEIGHAGVENNALWKEFKNAQREFNANRKNYFANLDEIHEKSAEVKKELIQKAKELSENVKSWKNTSEEMNLLMDKWKEAGSAGRELNDKLWDEFNTIRKSFFDARKQFFNERNAEFKKSSEAKNSIIEQAKEIVASNDFSKQVTDVMKDLDKKWKEAGYSGKDSNDKLWEEFKNIKEKFWDGKHADTQKRFKEVLARKESQVDTIKEEVNRLEEQVFETDNLDVVHSIERRIREKKDTIEKTKADIEDLKKRIDEEEAE